MSPPRAPTPSSSSMRRGLGFAGSSFASNVVIVTLGALVTSRLYGIEVIGEQALASVPYLLTMRFSTVSEQTALVRLISVLPRRDRSAAGTALAVFGFSAVVTVVVAAIVFTITAVLLGGTLRDNGLVAPALVLLVAYVVLENTNWSIDTVMAATGGLRELLYIRLVQAVTFVAVAVAIAVAGDEPNVWGLVFATVASFFVAFVLRMCTLSRFLLLTPGYEAMRSGMRELPAILKFGLAILPAQLSSGLATQSAIWIIGGTQSIGAVGAYSRAASVAVRLDDAAFRLNEVLLPQMMKQRLAGDEATSTYTIERTTRRVSVALGLIVASVGGAAHGVLELFGPGFSTAAHALTLLLVAHTAAVLSLVWNQPFIAADRPGLVSWITASRGLIVIPCMFVAAQRWGITAVALVWASAYVIEAIAKIAWARRTVLVGARSGVPLRFGTRIVVTAGVGYAAALGIDRSLGGPLGTLTALVGGGAAYVLAAIGTRALGGDDVRRVVVVSKRLITGRRRSSRQHAPAEQQPAGTTHGETR